MKPFIASDSTLMAAAAVLAVLAGCATAPQGRQADLRDRRPQGATLFEGGQSVGVAPVMRSYHGRRRPAARSARPR